MEELELETLKTMRILTTAKPDGMRESAVVPVAKPSIVTASIASRLNAELPAQVQVPAKASGEISFEFHWVNSVSRDYKQLITMNNAIRSSRDRTVLFKWKSLGLPYLYFHKASPTTLNNLVCLK